MDSLAQRPTNQQSDFFQQFKRHRRRRPRQSPLEAEILVTSLVGEYLWLVIRRNGRRIDQLHGKVSHRDGKSRERTWLLAVSMAFERRDHRWPGSRLLIRESVQEKAERRRAA